MNLFLDSNNSVLIVWVTMLDRNLYNLMSHVILQARLTESITTAYGYKGVITDRCSSACGSHWYNDLAFPLQSARGKWRHRSKRYIIHKYMSLYVYFLLVIFFVSGRVSLWYATPCPYPELYLGFPKVYWQKMVPMCTLISQYPPAWDTSLSAHTVSRQQRGEISWLTLADWRMKARGEEQKKADVSSVRFKYSICG